MRIAFSPFFLAIAGFLLGIFFCSFVDLGSVFLLLVTLLSIISLAAYLFDRKLKSFENAAASSNFSFLLFLTAIFLFSFAFGIARYEFSEWHTIDPNLDRLIDKRALFLAQIDDEPEQKAKGVSYTAKIEAVVLTGKNGKEYRQNVYGRVIFNSSPYPEFSYGDRVQLQGVLVKPQPFADDNGGLFDYPDYLGLSGIYYQFYSPRIQLISHTYGNPLKSILFSMKKALMANIEKILPNPESALLEGILFGAKTSLGPALEDDFRRAGVIHVVILSGYSITMIAGAIMSMLSFLPRFWRLLFGSFAIILFAIMTGGTAMVVRASIMAIFVLIAQYSRRNYNIKRSLLIAVFLMVFYNPKILAFDVSFQISLLSVIGLVYLSPIVKRRMAFITERWNLRETVVSTVATQIFVSPFILYQMGQISSIAVVVNILVLFCIPFIMTLGTLAAVIAFIHPLAAWLFASASYFLLKYMLTVVEFFSKLSFASINVPHFSLGLMLISYLIYAGFFYWYFQVRKQPHILEKASAGAVP